MTDQQFLDFVLDYYRADHPGASDAAIYDMLVQEHGADSRPATLLAAHIAGQFPLANS